MIDQEHELLRNIKANSSVLKEVLTKISQDLEYIDGVYRLYHGSFKVGSLHILKEEIVNLLRKLCPTGTELCRLFNEIIGEMPKRRELVGQLVPCIPMPNSNEELIADGRRGAEAVFHAKFFLELAIKYGDELEAPPPQPNSKWVGCLA